MPDSEPEYAQLAVTVFPFGMVAVCGC